MRASLCLIDQPSEELASWSENEGLGWCCQGSDGVVEAWQVLAESLCHAELSLSSPFEGTGILTSQSSCGVQKS